MHWLRAAGFAGVSILLSACASASPIPEIEVGQVWSIKDTANPSMRLTIEKIEPFRSDTVVHVSIKGGPVRTRISGEERIVTLGVIGHMPFEKSVLIDSLDQLEQSGAEGAHFFAQGYAIWKKDSGGIYSIPVMQAVEMISTVTK